MDHLRDLPSPNDFRPSDRRLDWNAFQKIVRSLLSQIEGDGRTIMHRYFGNRLVFSAVEKPPIRPQPDTKTFAVIQELDDTLLCANFVYDPNVPQMHDPNLGLSEANPIHVAKPRALQRTPFDGRSVILYGIEVSYSYENGSKRTATGEDEEEEHQLVTPAFFPGDIIRAIRGPTGYTIGGTPVSWEDLNTAGRQWAKTKPPEE